MATNSIGINKVNVSTTTDHELARKIARLAFRSDISRNEYVRRLMRMAVEQGILFVEESRSAVALIALTVAVTWAALAPGDEFAKIARARGRRRDDAVVELIEGGAA